MVSTLFPRSLLHLMSWDRGRWSVSLPVGPSAHQPVYLLPPCQGISSSLNLENQLVQKGMTRLLILLLPPQPAVCLRGHVFPSSGTYFHHLWKRFEWADPGVPLMPKFCEPQELLLKSEMGSTLAPHFEKNFIQIVYMKNYY